MTESREPRSPLKFDLTLLNSLSIGESHPSKTDRIDIFIPIGLITLGTILLISASLFVFISVQNINGTFASNGAEISTEAVTKSIEQGLLPKNDTLSVGEPVSMTIESLKIDAPIELVDYTASMAMEVPKNINVVGWFRYGAKAGEIGNAVFTAHLNNSLGQKGVFYNLNQLKVGDKILVKDSFAAQQSFTVTASTLYQINALPMDDIFGPSDKAQIQLITCAGKWNWKRWSYTERLLVTAVKD